MKLFYFVDPRRPVVNEEVTEVTDGLACALSGLGCVPSLVTWDVSTAALVCLDVGSTFANGEQDSHCKPRLEAGDWLVIPEIVRLDEDASYCIQQLVGYCTRQGLKTAVVFYDAGPLKDPRQGDLEAECAAYMQQLALADLILPISESTADDLVSFFLNRLYFQMETLPVIAPVPLPTKEQRTATAWLEYAQQALGLINNSNTPWLHIKKIFFWVDQTCQGQNDKPAASEVCSLANYLQRTSIPVTPIKWVSTRREFDIPNVLELEYLSIEGGPEIGDWDAELPRNNETGAWLLIPESITVYPVDTIQSIIDLAKKKKMQLGVIYDERSNVKADVLRSEYARWIAHFDRVLCISEQYRAALLEYCDIHLERLVNIEQRLTSVALFENHGSPDWQEYGKRILTGLSEGTDWRIKVYPAVDVMPSRVGFHAPILSICISTYNRARWLEVSLSLLFKQTASYRDVVEVIVCDNASTDNTSNVVAPYSAETNFHYFRNPQNVGMLGNLKVTAQHARGQYVWILGDDDLLFDGAVENVLKAILEHPEVSLIYLNYAYTRVAEANKVGNLEQFFQKSTPISQPGPDVYAPISRISTLSANFFTAIYCLIYRRDHALLAYSQNTEGRPFSTMLTSIPTSYYVCHHMMDEPGYWIGDPCVLVNMNVSWGKYVPLWVLERLPELFDLAEKKGAKPDEVDHWRADNMPGALHYLKKIYFSDTEKNIKYFSIERFISRHKHLKEFRQGLREFMTIYEKAYRYEHPYARIEPKKLLARFGLQNG